MFTRQLLVIVLAASLASCAAPVRRAGTAPDPSPAAATSPDDEWGAYGRDDGGSRYSPLAQIDRGNVGRLGVAWVYRTGDVATKENAASESSFEATPLLVDGTLYLSTPFGRVVALDPERGTRRWSYDPRVDLQAGYGDFASRGVATWLDSVAPAGARCRRRIFVGTIDARLIALDAAVGASCADFGAAGTVDLRRDLRNGAEYPAEYEVTSPPAVIGGLVVVGSAIADNNRAAAPSGVVRAYDARTGTLRWSWDPVAQSAGDSASRTWGGAVGVRTGAANAWSVISADPARDLVFVPTGSPSPDYYGATRLGSNRYANSVTALRASTGQVVWSFQVVHHDLWDYDVPAQPVLFTARRGGVDVPALAQATKMGNLFLLNRETGEPLFPVEERPVPRSTVPGEQAWPTQPFPTLPKPLVPQRLTADEAWGITPADREWCRATIASLRSEGIFTPPSVAGTLVVPGNVGGVNWGGVAVDGSRGLIIAATNRLPAVVRLVPRASYDSVEKANTHGEMAPQSGTAYGIWREILRSPSRLPCNAPPWGALTAVDAATGLVRWEVPLGTFPRVPAEAQLGETGSPNLGGAIVTAGRLVFIGATIFDNHVRAFDVETGAKLWEAALPVSATATPMTYRIRGKQYVVIAAGGHAKSGVPLGDYVYAFTLR